MADTYPGSPWIPPSDILPDGLTTCPDSLFQPLVCSVLPPSWKDFPFSCYFAVIACSCLTRVSHSVQKTIPNDLALFAENGDEAAFRRVVDALSGLTFSSAMRRTADRGMAEEVTQNVFAILARKASKLHGHSSLEGWVFTTTRYEAAMAMRKRQQHLRKLEALEMESQAEIDQHADIEDLPHLEESLDRLAAADR
ncbi:MAG: hypothetical protein ACI9MB_004930, partial [Verrucomicrobiales bacterium]